MNVHDYVAEYMRLRKWKEAQPAQGSTDDVVMEVEVEVVVEVFEPAIMSRFHFHVIFFFFIAFCKCNLCFGFERVDLEKRIFVFFLFTVYF